MQLKDEVEEILKRSPESRNSDIVLVTMVWNEFYSDYVFTNPNSGDNFILLKHLGRLPTQESIKRIRSKFNEKFKYLPTDLKVVKRRKINEDRWRTENGYPVREEIKHSSDKSKSYTEKVLDKPELLNQGNLF